MLSAWLLAGPVLAQSPTLPQPAAFANVNGNEFPITQGMVVARGTLSPDGKSCRVPVVHLKDKTPTGGTGPGFRSEIGVRITSDCAVVVQKLGVTLPLPQLAYPLGGT
jgi:hypothetical protein